ncbi:unnamed protein product, partial [Rotaria magnacalcarata]
MTWLIDHNSTPFSAENLFPLKPSTVALTIVW